jgi:hypothetical protein
MLLLYLTFFRHVILRPVALLFIFFYAFVTPTITILLLMLLFLIIQNKKIEIYFHNCSRTIMKIKGCRTRVSNLFQSMYGKSMQHTSTFHQIKYKPICRYITYESISFQKNSPPTRWHGVIKLELGLALIAQITWNASTEASKYSCKDSNHRQSFHHQYTLTHFYFIQFLYTIHPKIRHNILLLLFIIFYFIPCKKKLE